MHRAHRIALITGLSLAGLAALSACRDTPAGAASAPAPEPLAAPIPSAGAAAGDTLLDVAALTAGRDQRDLHTVRHVDLERYMGLWYEIARYPNSFQRGLVAVTAEYTLRDDGKVRVVNSGRKGSLTGEITRSTAKAWVVDEETNAKLAVQFFWPFQAPYWIIDLCPEYQWAVVGQPSREYLWILARSTELDDSILEGIYARLRKQAYDPDKLQMTPQPPPARQ